MPARLQAALDAWHPPCPIPREDIEQHRLPGRKGRWPVQNYVSKIDDRGNARRLLDHFGDRIRFADGQKAWVRTLSTASAGWMPAAAAPAWRASSPTR